VDGDVLPEAPLSAIDKGSARGVATLVGTNRDEWKLFMVSDTRALRLSEDGLARRFRRVFERLGDPGTELSRRAFEVYYRVRGPRGGELSERWAAFQSDRIFHYPASRLADVQCRHSPDTYAYLFEWTPPILGARIGACHGLELPFVFGTLRNPLLRPLWGSTRGAYHLSRDMQKAWIRFAHTGCPAHGGLPDWPAYTLARRSTLALGPEYTLRDDPHERARGFWGGIIRDAKLPWASASAVPSGSAA
jgi:para-nitrobenzyl esterase